MEKKHKIFISAIVIGIVLGIVVGFIMADRYTEALPVFDFVSGFYMNALKMMILPLVFCSIVTGICNLGSIKMLGSLGGKVFLYFCGTTILAAIVGLIVPQVLNLGKNVNLTMMESDVTAIGLSSVSDTFRNLIPSNPIQAFAEGNMLQVLTFAVIIGIACLAVGEKAAPFINVVDSVNEIAMKIVSVVMLTTPIGVFASIVTTICNCGIRTVGDLAFVLVMIFATYLIFVLLFDCVMLKFVAKVPLKRFFPAALPALLNAFGTASSSATLPISKKCLEEELDVPNEITSLTLPLGATINMDANSIIMSFVIVFFANACGVNIGLGQMLMLLFVNVLLSIGTPGIPYGNNAAYAGVAAMVGFPAGTVGIFASLNAICDMGTTCVNVMGDLTASLVIHRINQKKK